MEIRLGGWAVRVAINWASGLRVAVDARTNLANPAWIPLATNGSGFCPQLRALPGAARHRGAGGQAAQHHAPPHRWKLVHVRNQEAAGAGGRARSRSFSAHSIKGDRCKQPDLPQQNCQEALAEPAPNRNRDQHQQPSPRPCQARSPLKLTSPIEEHLKNDQPYEGEGIKCQLPDILNTVLPNQFQPK